LSFSAVARVPTGTWRDCNAYSANTAVDLRGASTIGTERRCPVDRHLDVRTTKSPHKAGFLINRSENCG
jgi:hypothetical protein